MDENFRTVPTSRDDLYHVALPGIRKDANWISHMEMATQTAVRIMISASGNKEAILNNKRNLSILMRRLLKSIGNNEAELLEASQTKLQDFESSPKLREICDYIIADAHYNYHLNDSEFKTIDLGGGNTSQVECNYGTPRELAPAFETPFQGEYKVNPYKAYAKRARICKEQYSDTEGFMKAPLVKIIRESANNYVYEHDLDNEGIRLTHTLDSSWWHTDEKNFEQVWNHIENLYSDLSKIVSSDKENSFLQEKTLLISQIGWWYFQVMPYTRGSGAIGIGLLQSLFDYSGIKNSPYKNGISPDLEALVTPLQMYVENFSDFFTKKFEMS